MPPIYWIPKLHKTPYKARFIAGSRSCTTTRLSKLITECLKLVRSHCTAYCKMIRERTGVKGMWIINNSLDVIRTLEEKQLSLTHVSTWDFSTLYTSLPHSFTFRIVNFPHMDGNIPANPAYGVYISQLVRYTRICTSKVDFLNTLRGRSSRLQQQGFLTNLLQRTFTKFFNRHGLIVVKYGATLREMRFATQA